MTEDHSDQSVSQTLVFLYTVFDPFYTIFGGHLKNDAVSFVDVGAESCYQQFVLKLEDGPKGLILELFGWGGLGTIQFKAWSDG